MDRGDDSLKIAERERARADTEAHLEKVRSIYKFHFFFTALVFAILSFAIQFPVETDYVWIKVIETGSWLIIAFTALLSLKQIGGFSPEDTLKYHSGLSKGWRYIMWSLFIVGVSLLLVAKIMSSFSNVTPELDKTNKVRTTVNKASALTEIEGKERKVKRDEAIDSQNK